MTIVFWILGIAVVLGIVYAVRRSNEADRACCEVKPSTFPARKDVVPPATVSTPKKVAKRVVKRKTK